MKRFLLGWAIMTIFVLGISATKTVADNCAPRLVNKFFFCGAVDKSKNGGTFEMLFGPANNSFFDVETEFGFGTCACATKGNLSNPQFDNSNDLICTLGGGLGTPQNDGAFPGGIAMTGSTVQDLHGTRIINGDLLFGFGNNSFADQFVFDCAEEHLH